MKRINTLLLACCSLGFLAGCGESEITIEIMDLPKTTFYCGEEFSNNGISLKVTLPDGESFVTEDVQTSKPTINAPGTQSVKVFYSNEKYDYDGFVTYEINVIDWSNEEKAIFSETSISSFAGVYYPKMDGMRIETELDDDGSIIDYWIVKENASFKDLDAYTELLKNYHVRKKVVDAAGSRDVDYKFYEQSAVPTDFRDLYDLNDAVCYKYCASYEYIDMSYGQLYNLYDNEIEDTLVIGLNDNNDLIIRYIADNIYMETALSCEVNEHLDFSQLFNGTVVTYLNQNLFGFTDEDGQMYSGFLDYVAPLAKEDFIFPSYEPDVCSISNYGSLYPWLHGEDDLSFEIEIDSNDKDEYDNFIASLDANSSFTKTTKQDKIRGKNVDITVYKIESKDYVGNLTIEVSDFIEDGMSYYSTEGTTRSQVTVGCYRVYYILQAPEIITPTQLELFRIYDVYYNLGTYTSDDFDFYEDGTVGGLIKFSAKEDNISSKEEAVDKFVNDCLQGYTCTSPKEDKTVSGTTICATTYANADYVVEVYGYFAGNGKYAVEFSVAIAPEK